MKTDIRQHDITDCAAASICSVARHYGYDIPLATIREVSGTDNMGTSVKGVLDACNTLGFRASGYKSEDRDIEVLRKVEFPVILHTVNRKGDLHFIVLYSIGDRKAVVMDPAEGRHIRMSLAELKKEWTGILVTVSPDPGRAIQNTTQSESFNQSCISLLAKSRSDILLSIPGFLLSIISGICISVVLQNIIDKVIPSGDVHLLARTSAIAGLLVAFTLAATAGANRRMIRSGTRTDACLTLEYLRHLFTLSPGFFARRSSGELNSRITDAMKVRRLLTDGVVCLVTGTMLLAGSFALMFTYYWKLALLTLAFIPLYIALFITVKKINGRMNRKMVENAADFEKNSVESISSIRAIKYFGSGRAGIGSLEKCYYDLCSSIARNAENQNKFAISSEAISKLLSLTIIAAGSFFIFRGRLTTGELVSFYSLSAWFASPLGEMVNLSQWWNEASLSMERLRDITQMPPEKSGGLDADLSETEDITMLDLSFSYPGCPKLLENFNLTIPKGQITAITGHSGCGKSSLASLLMRDYSPTGGKILVGDTDIALLDTATWRRYISIVPQDAGITSGTILENVTGGENSPDLKRVGSIIEELGLRDFVVSLPLGILSQTGEHGCLLSGGQKQRLALARALYRNPKVLILDEATASLDAESQAIILEKVRKLRDEGRTVIMITHKMDNITIADNICRMK